MKRLPLLALLLAPLLAVTLVSDPAPGTAADESTERAAILSLIAPRHGETVCDLGCGNGTWTFPLAEAVGNEGRVFAVDIDRRKLDQVRKRQQSEGVANVQVIHSVADNPMLPADTMDAVFLNDVIDYVERRALAGFLEGIRQSLKPTGRLVIRDPNGGADRIIAECYRAGFALVEAKIPLRGAPQRSFADSWYALKLRVAEGMQHAILPRLGHPERRRTRLLMAEELYRLGLVDRTELRTLWDRVENTDAPFDPRRDEAGDLIRAAELLGVLNTERAADLRKRVETQAGESPR